MAGSAADERLMIYLSDHHAGSEAGERLARRCAAANASNELGTYIHRALLPAIELDRALLQQAFDAIDAKPSALKDLGARIGELVGRAKLNGQLTGYSPLSRVIEVEGLIAGVTAKRGLWVTLDSLRNRPGYAALPDVASRITAADDQLDQLQRHHAEAVLAAFVLAG